MVDVISNLAARYERTREEVLSLQEYLEICKREPLAYATPPSGCSRPSASPNWWTRATTPRSRASSPTRSSRSTRPSASSMAWKTPSNRWCPTSGHAAQGLEEKKQILYLLGPVGGGKSSIAERLKQLMEHVPFYSIKGSPVNEIAAGPVRRGRGRRDPREGIRHPAPLPAAHPVALGGQAAGRVRRRHPPVPGGQALPLGAAPDRGRQDRAGRREQPGHLLAGRQDRHPQARGPTPRTTRTPTPTRAACAWRTRACWSSSKCSRRRSRCCIRC